MMKSAQHVVFSLIVLVCFTGFAMAQANRYAVQLGAAPTLEGAQEMVKQLKDKGLDTYIVKSEVAGKGTFYRVRAGKFPTQADARKYGADLQQKGIVTEYFIAVFDQPLLDFTPPNKTNASSSPPSQTPPQSRPPVSQSQGANIQATVSTNNPASASTPSTNTSPPTTSASAPVPIPSTVKFVKFRDATVGYSFEIPQYWEGGSLDAKEAQDQKKSPASQFKSYQDLAFTYAVWNSLDKAKTPVNDNDLIVGAILRGMGSDSGTLQLTEASRRVVSEGGSIKTYMDLRAVFKPPGQEGPLDFLGKAVIVRAEDGILLVVTFYTKFGPPYVGSIADRIIASVRAPG
jgi:SPOR domain